MDEERREGKWEGKVSARLKGSKVQDVWPLVEDFCSLHKWLPTIDTCHQVDQTIIGVRPGMIQYYASMITSPSGETTIKLAKEKLVEIDPIQRRLRYEILDNNMGFKYCMKQTHGYNSREQEHQERSTRNNTRDLYLVRISNYPISKSGQIQPQLNLLLKYYTLRVYSTLTKPSLSFMQGIFHGNLHTSHPFSRKNFLFREKKTQFAGSFKSTPSATLKANAIKSAVVNLDGGFICLLVLSLVNRQLIYNFSEELFAGAGILAIEHADFDGIERLALVTGGEIASTFDNPESVKLGHCKLIEDILIGEVKLIHCSGVEMGQACTIVLRGACRHVLAEADRSLHDALCALSQTGNDSRVVFLGSRWPEMIMAKEEDELAKKTPGKKSDAIETFSWALLAFPTIIGQCWFGQC